MKKIYNIIATLSVCAIAIIATSCESREQMSYGGDIALSQPTVTVTDAQFNSLTFAWTPVSGAVEYGYTLTNEDGDVVDGGLTKVDSVKIEDLDYSTNYTFHLHAYAAVESENTTSEEITLTTATPFYPVVDESGTYTSCLVTGSTSWTTTLTEVREAGNDSEFGTFTLTSWYNHEGYDLQFTVNSDNTIKVLNGTLDEATGMVKVLAGPSTIKTNQHVRSGALIDESQCIFDRANQTLTLFVRSTKDATREGTDTFEW